MNSENLEIYSPQLPPEVLLFDADGTLIDSVEIVTRAFAQMYKEQFGTERPASDFVFAVGPPLDQSMMRLEPGCSPERAAELVAHYRSIYLPLAMQTPLYPGIKQLLEDLHGRGIRMAVATSKLENVASELLERLGVSQYFETISGAEARMDTAGKTFVVQKAIDRLGVAGLVRDPSPVVMVGDRIFDVIGAGALHIPTLLVDWAGTAQPGEEALAFASTTKVEEVPALLGL